MRGTVAVMVVLAVLTAAALAWLALQVHRPVAPEANLSLDGLLAGAPEEFRRVTGPAPLEFPADHGAHPGFRSEWWYFTGSLADADGTPLGWQFTLFRFGLGGEAAAVDSPARESRFAADAVWMGHLALSDGRTQRFHSRERFARGALGLAGAGPDRWWIRDWQVIRRDGTWRVRAAAPEFGVDLALSPRKPIVPQGDGGYSRKGPEQGNASRYYSVTRLQTTGTVTVDGERLAVSGTSWLDREWGSSQLPAEVAGWDWFALHLDDGRDVMVYRLRTDDGQASPFSAGVVVAADGTVTRLTADEFGARPQRSWTDPSGVAWPVAWRVEIPTAGLELAVEALFDEQRWYGRVAYWEGAVRVRDVASGEPAGRGYLELSGYADAAGSPRR